MIIPVPQFGFFIRIIWISYFFTGPRNDVDREPIFV
jgi:hypothetical protein